MTKQYYYQFANGEYSDYCVGGLYLCDHEVNEDEWKAHYKMYQGQSSRLFQAIPRDNSTNGYGGTIKLGSYEYKAYRDYRNNNPEKSFQELHGMVAVECTELWRD